MVSLETMRVLLLSLRATEGSMAISLFVGQPFTVALSKAEALPYV